MPEKDTLETKWLERIADKVPMEVAGPVVILVVLLLVTPAILGEISNNLVGVYGYLVIIGAVVFFSGSSMLLHAISKYHERERKASFQNITKTDTLEKQKTNLETEQQVEEAITLMEGKKDEQNK